MQLAQPQLLSMDAATYFFVNSGVFISIVAGIFFVLGLWFGRLLWGRYKKGLREAEAVIDNLKAEVSVLKRRMVEKPKLGVTLFSHSAPLALAPLPIAKGPFFPVSRMFYIWGEDDFELPSPTPQPTAESRAFSVWTEPEWVPLKTCLYAPGRPFSLWTAPDWKSPVTKSAAPARSQAFTLWTESGYKPVPRSLYLPGRPHTLWTAAERIPSLAGGKLPKSKAHTLWTLLEFIPNHQILYPENASFTLWTEADYQQPMPQQTALPPSRAFSIWTEKSKNPFVALSSAVQSAGGSIFSRAVSAAKNALGIPPVTREAPVETPRAPAVIPQEAAKPEPPPPAIFPVSRAFTVWMESTPAVAPESRAKTRRVPILQGTSELDLGIQQPIIPQAGSAKSAVIYMADIVSGRVRHDHQLGIVYKEKPAASDDLTILKGIGDTIEGQLNKLGIYTFKQIALWTEHQAREVSQRLAFKDRAIRERWVEQARECHLKAHGEAL